MRQKSTVNHLVALIAGTISAAAAAQAQTRAQAQAGESCFTGLAATRNFSLGAPRHVIPSPDGEFVFFLRSGPRDTKLGLYQFDVKAGTERALALPAEGPEHLSAEEKARRERARMTLTGITDFALSRDGHRILLSQADHLSLLNLPAAQPTPLPGAGWIGPRLAPDGTAVAAVRDNDVHIIDLATMTDSALTRGGTDTVTHGLAEFAAAEELERSDGIWWSPDSSRLLYEEADSTGVERHFIADPGNPSAQPTEFRYPRAGTANAKIRLGLIARTGGATTWLDWDSTAYPYLARVIWQKAGKLTLVVLNRAQTEEVLLAVDPATGRTSRLLTDTDAAWLNLTPDHGLAPSAKPLPYWLPDNQGFLWAAERDGQWRLELRHPDGSLDHAITPASLPFIALDDVDPEAGSVVVTASPDRLTTNAFRIPLGGGAARKLTNVVGLHDVTTGEEQHALLADTFSSADNSAGTALRGADGSLITLLPSAAELPPEAPNLQFTSAGPQGFDAVVIRPHNFAAHQRLPVVLSVYAGPTVKLVLRAPRHFLEDQCLADQGFIVVTIDGRGTPGRDHDFERTTKYDLIDIPLQDQIDGLRALGDRFHEMDLSRTGVTGWSFGGYFTAMATIRHPEVFKAGAAGAPVVDFADYDTAYTERYLGEPQAHPEAYKVSNVLTYAEQLARPLLIMHGLTDDNVYFVNTFKLTQALFAAGKPYQLVILPGTHLLPDPKIRARVDETRATFLQEHLR